MVIPKGSFAVISDGLLCRKSRFEIATDDGTVERLNNKAKLVMHEAYGIRTATNHMRRAYHCLSHAPLPQTWEAFL